MLQVIYKRGKIPLVLFRLLKKKKKKNKQTRNFIVTACNKKPRRGPDDSRGPHLSGLSLSPPSATSRSALSLFTSNSKPTRGQRTSPDQTGPAGQRFTRQGARLGEPAPWGRDSRASVSPAAVRTQRSSPSPGPWR